MQGPMKARPRPMSEIYPRRATSVPSLPRAGISDVVSSPQQLSGSASKSRQSWQGTSAVSMAGGGSIGQQPLNVKAISADTWMKGLSPNARHSQAEACIVRLLRRIDMQQDAGRFGRGHANSFLLDRAARIDTWKHKDAAESDHHSDTNSFAGWIHFKDGSTAWWRLDRPSPFRPPAFIARIANYPTQRELQLLAATSGRVIADAARAWSGGDPVATANGHLRGVCRALVMNVFAQL